MGLLEDTGFDPVWGVQNHASGLMLFVDETQEGATLASVEGDNPPQLFYLDEESLYALYEVLGEYYGEPDDELEEDETEDDEDWEEDEEDIDPIYTEGYDQGWQAGYEAQLDAR